MSERIDITNTERHALYLRDNCACLWCGIQVVPGASTHSADAATLDHLIPRASGGSDERRNLTTACTRCNTRRNKRSVGEWLSERADAGVNVQDVRREMRNRKRRQLDLDAGAKQAGVVAATLRKVAVIQRRMLIERLT